MAVGLAILANSRPYEGLVFAVPIAAAMFLWLLGRSGHAVAFRVTLRRVVLPILITVALAGAATGYYVLSRHGQSVANGVSGEP